MANLFENANALSLEPNIIVIGDRVTWRKSNLNTDYPTATHTAKYISRIAGSSNNEFTITGTAENNDFLFTITSAASASFTIGDYHWQLEITRNSDSERVIIQRGTWSLVSDLDNNLDPRSHAETMLDKIESLLEGKADGDVSSYSIAGRSLTKLSPDELVQWREYYQREVVNQRRIKAIRNGKATSASVKVRF